MSSTTFEFPLTTRMVRAGAGAGKTRRLTEEVLSYAKIFFRDEGRWPNVVVTTFTRKATQELRERLMLKVLESEPELSGFVTSRAHLSVTTIHGVLDMYLRRHGQAIGLEPAFRLLREEEARIQAAQWLREEIFSVDAELLNT